MKKWNSRKLVITVVVLLCLLYMGNGDVAEYADRLPERMQALIDLLERLAPMVGAVITGVAYLLKQGEVDKVEAGK